MIQDLHVIIMSSNIILIIQAAYSHPFDPFKGALDKYNIIPQLFPKEVGIFIPLEVSAWVMSVCWV